jgi:hypothetical protein
MASQQTTAVPEVAGVHWASEKATVERVARRTPRRASAASYRPPTTPLDSERGSANADARRVPSAEAASSWTHLGA